MIRRNRNRPDVAALNAAERLNVALAELHMAMDGRKKSDRSLWNEVAAGHARAAAAHAARVLGALHLVG